MKPYHVSPQIFSMLWLAAGTPILLLTFDNHDENIVKLYFSSAV